MKVLVVKVKTRDDLRIIDAFQKLRPAKNLVLSSWGASSASCTAVVDAQAQTFSICVLLLS